MAGRGAPVARPVWMKQAEEAKLKDEEQKAAAARAAFDATFNDLETPAGTLAEEEASDSDADESKKLANKPIGPADPGKCTAAGTGVAGGAAGAAASFVIVTKDSDNRRVPHGGAHIKVRITPGVGVGGVEQEALVKDHGDGTYTVTYAVAKRGDYMVSVECNGLPILNSPFPVFFSGGNAPLINGLLPPSGAVLGSSPFGTGQNLTPFTGVASGLFPGMLGMIPGVLPGATGGAILPGLGASLGEVCRDYLNGRCARGDCKYNHPPQAQLMAALAAGSTMGGLSQMPMPPSAAAMAAAQSIAAAQAYQAAQARVVAQESSASKEEENKPSSPNDKQKEAIPRTVQVSNLNPMLTADQLKTLFSFCGTVSDCHIAESKQLAYVEYAKLEEAKAALALNNMEVGDRPINVEMAKSVPSKKSSSVSSVPAANGLQPPPLPVMMQQAVAMQQLQFQQALLVQQAMAAQQAAVRAATVKSASEMASARAAEISKTLKVDGEEQEEKDTSGARSPSRSRQSKSRSPIRYRRDRRSRSRSRSPIRYRRDRRSRSRSRDRFVQRSHSRDRGRFYRRREDYHLFYSRHRWERDRERDNENRSSQNSTSGRISQDRSHHHSPFPRSRKDQSRSPQKVRREDSSSRHRSLRSRSPPKELHRSSKSPLKEVHQSVSHNEKFAEKNDVEKERQMSPTLRMDDQTIDDQMRLPKSQLKGISPRKASPKKASVQYTNEITNSTGVKVDANSIMLEGDAGPKQSSAHVFDGPESVKALDHGDKSEEIYHKEKRRHKKDDDHHKHDKKRKRHKHRRHRSPSDSQDGLPSLQDGKTKPPGSDDSASFKRSHQKKTKPSRSMSISSSASD